MVKLLGVNIRIVSNEFNFFSSNYYYYYSFIVSVSLLCVCIIKKTLEDERKITQIQEK